MALPVGHCRVRHLPTGRILMRPIANAREMADTHPAEYALEHDPHARSITERLTSMGGAVRAFAREHGIAAPLAADTSHVVAQLIPLAEAGILTLPEHP